MGLLDATVRKAVAQAIGLLNGAPITVRRVTNTWSLTQGTPDLGATATDFTRATGSFITDGFAIGNVILTKGFTNAGNNGTFTVTAVAATALTVSTALTIEAQGTGKTIARITDYSVKSTPRFDFKAREIDGTIIQAGDSYVLVAASQIAIAPAPHTDRVIIAGSEYELVRVETIMSGDEAAAYRLQLRR